MQTTKLLLAAVCGMAMSTAAHAQLLGGGGLGGLGGLSGGVGHTVGGTLGGSLGTRANKSVDRRSGRASADAGLDGAVSGALDSATGVTGPDGASKSVNASGKADKRVSKSARAEADGPGTDDGRSLLGGATSTAGHAVGSASGQLSGTAQRAQGVGAGAAGGSAAGNGSGSGSGSAGGGELAGAGMLSGAGSLSKSVTVAPGTIVEDARGRTVGKIHEVRQAANGALDTVVVEVGDKLAALPASSLSVSGDVVTTTMTKGEVKKMASADATSTEPSAASNGGQSASTAEADRSTADRR